MSAAQGDQRRRSPHLHKETRMPKRLPTLATMMLAGLLCLAAGPIASAPAAEPWWQVLDGSRPSHLWEPKDAEEIQEVKTEKTGFGFLAFLGEVKVGGVVVGCLAAGDVGGPPASDFCEPFTGFPAAETAAEFETMLEGPYGAGEVEVTGGPVGTAPFQVTTRWGVPQVTVTPIFG